ncbi:MAG: hypothetical protein V4508_19660 [Pseudomonadota bacterium]
MTIFGLGIHILIAIYFAIHAVRTGRELYWVVLLFMFPGIGSLVYFFAVYLPQSRLQHGLRKAGTVVKNSLDPGRDLRDAQQAFDLTPTAHNQMRLAQALLAAGMVAQAVEQYDACLRGPFAKDAEIGLGAAQARLAHKQPQAAIELLLALGTNHPGFRPEQVGLLLAKSYDAAGLQAEAGSQFEQLVARFAGVELRAEYALWALAQGQQGLAERQMVEIEHARKHMSKHTRSLHVDLLRRLDAASK